ncbi:MAG: hybrid sensor histidine kinase/response regulator [Pseudolabrys sp.]|nr:hybrid sensor histidine kinase/response regulator [Pseudolabrys sp.]
MKADNIDAAADWRLDYLFSTGASSWLIHLGVITLTFVVLNESGSASWGQGWGAAWFAVMLTLSLVLAGLSLAYVRKWLPPVRARWFGAGHSVVTALTGLTWGGGAIACAVTGSFQTVVIYTLVLGGTALGAVSSQHAWLRSCMLSVWTSVPLLALAFVIYGRDLQSTAMAGMILLFGATLTILALRMHRFLAANVAMAHDLARKNRELSATTEQLREAHDAKLRFLAQASHDLRQPIHAIGLFIECLKGLCTGREGKEILSNVDRSLDSLSRLCRSLLDLSAIDVGQVRPNPVDTALEDVIGDVVRQAQETARAQSVRLRSVRTRLWVHTDPALLQVMLQNLVSNALKYAPGGKVLVGVRRRNGRAAIEVIDQGPGIAPEDRNRIFEEFVRLDRYRGGRIEGLGLGLSIVKRLCELMALSITLRSQPGQGSAFRIDGLACVPPRLEAPVPPPRNYHRRLEGLRILVIDDDESVRESTVRVLVRWGCSVRATAGPKLYPGTVHDVDFILCDQDLGAELNGVDVIRHLRALAGRDIPAAIATGTDITLLRDHAADDGIIVLSKPIRPAQLRSLLLSAIVSQIQTRPSSAATPAAAARVETSSARRTAET